MFLSSIKYFNENIYSLAVSLLLALWFNGVSGLINYYLPNRGLAISIVLLLIPLVVFLSDNGKLDELYKPPNIEYPILASTVQQGQYQRRK